VVENLPSKCKALSFKKKKKGRKKEGRKEGGREGGREECRKNFQNCLYL
jgi:hypothetical protein